MVLCGVGVRLVLENAVVPERRDLRRLHAVHSALRCIRTAVVHDISRSQQQTEIAFVDCRSRQSDRSRHQPVSRHQRISHRIRRASNPHRPLIRRRVQIRRSFNPCLASKISNPLQPLPLPLLRRPPEAAVADRDRPYQVVDIQCRMRANQRNRNHRVSTSSGGLTLRHN